MNTTNNAPLAGIRVLDLSTVVAGPFGSEILGYLGADVIRIDAPPAAAPWPERPAGTPVSEAEGFVWALQRNKRSICLDLKSEQGRKAFMDLVATADVVYDNFRAGVLQRLGIDHAALRVVNPRIISCSITGFGPTGPWAEVGAYDVAVQALGGSMGITGPGGKDDMPCRLGMPIGDIAAALYAVIGVLAALEERQQSGVGQALDVALLDVQLALNTYRVPQVFGGAIEFTTSSPRKGGAGTVPYGPFQCSDEGWLVIGVASNFWKAFCTAMNAGDLLDDARFRTLALRQQNQAELEALLERRFRARSAEEWESKLVEHGVPAARVNDIRGAFFQAQAKAREMLVAFTEPGGRVVHAAASPLRFSGEPSLPQRPPTPIGSDTDTILATLADALAQPAQRADRANAAPTDDRHARIAAMAALPGPLNGVLVLELCGDEPSGTFGTQILADLGATVLKIERPPADEPGPTPLPADGAPVRRDIAYTFGLNRNKRSLCLDLKDPAGRAVLMDLVHVADVVYDNYKPGVMARLEADEARLRHINPRIICCSVSGFGQTGPWATHPGYDATVQAAGGAMSITGTGEPGSAPVRWGNPVGGIGGALYAVVGILAALRRRHVTDTGAALDISLLDAQLAMQAYRVPPAIAGVRYSAQPRRGGSGALPYGPFLARDRRWFVLGITGQFWAKACDALGHSEWKDDPRFVNETLRGQNESALNALVAEAMLTQDSDEWQRRFVGLGIPGAKVATIREAFSHPHVALRNMLVSFDHPLGRHVQVAGNPLKLGSQGNVQFRAAPGLGEDTDAVLSALLHHDEQSRQALRATGAIWWPMTGPVYDRPSVV